MKLIALTLSVCMAWQAPSAQAPPGYYLGPEVDLPDSLYAPPLAGAFSLRIDRVARDVSEARLLSIAERLVPTRETILTAQAGITTPVLLRRLDAAASAPDDRWWWDEVDQVWTPFAVTGSAVSYYMDRIRERSRGRNPFGSGPHGGALEYSARVELPPDGADPRVHRVVRQTLSWYYHCGSMCAMGFKQERVVEFGVDGRPIRVVGDGRPSVWMS